MMGLPANNQEQVRKFGNVTQWWYWYCSMVDVMMIWLHDWQSEWEICASSGLLFQAKQASSIGCFVGWFQNPQWRDSRSRWKRRRFGRGAAGWRAAWVKRKTQVMAMTILRDQAVTMRAAQEKQAVAKWLSHQGKPFERQRPKIRCRQSLGLSTHRALSF